MFVHITASISGNLGSKYSSYSCTTPATVTTREMSVIFTSAAKVVTPWFTAAATATDLLSNRACAYKSYLSSNPRVSGETTSTHNESLESATSLNDSAKWSPAWSYCVSDFILQSPAKLPIDPIWYARRNMTSGWPVRRKICILSPTWIRSDHAIQIRRFRARSLFSPS